MSLITPGLCSVTFRKRPVDEVIAIAAGAGLRAIEWGADFHVPAGDDSRARRVAAACADAGLACPSYGSYWFAGHSDAQDLRPVLDSALALGAATVRVWCRRGFEPDGSADDRAAVVAALVEAAAQADEAGVRLALEFHPGTLTLTAASTVQLLEEVSASSLSTYWQPLPGAPAGEALDELRVVRPWLAHLHVFWWDRDGTRRPLVEGEELWVPALDEVDGDRCAYLEFVADDDPQRLAADAAVLIDWLR